MRRGQADQDKVQVFIQDGAAERFIAVQIIAQDRRPQGAILAATRRQPALRGIRPVPK